MLIVKIALHWVERTSSELNLYVHRCKSKQIQDDESWLQCNKNFSYNCKVEKKLIALQRKNIFHIKSFYLSLYQLFGIFYSFKFML